MTHYMNLKPTPFYAIQVGTKDIELRLLDEKRQMIQVGDLIEFQITDDSNCKLTVIVTGLYKFSSFKELYESLPLIRCGYTKDNIDNASLSDMDLYYSKAKQKKYGVVGIEIKLYKNQGEIIMELFDKLKKKKQTNNDIEQEGQDSVQGFLWKDIKDVFSNSSNDIKTYEKADAFVLNAAYKTPMEALVNSASYIEVNHCLRILGQVTLSIIMFLNLQNIITKYLWKQQRKILICYQKN